MRILAIGAHPDDIELGCGGSLAFFRKTGHQTYALVLTRGEASGDPSVREKECRQAAEAIGVDKLFFSSLADTKISDGVDTVRAIEDVIDTVGPDLIFTHSSKDAHQDHRNTHLASMSAARYASRVLLYESPAAMRDFCPQAFIDISSTITLKLKAVQAFNSQSRKPYINGQKRPNDPCRDCEKYSQMSNAVAGLARYRGYQAGIELAEAFEVARYVIDVHGLPSTPVGIGNEGGRGNALSNTRIFNPR